MEPGIKPLTHGLSYEGITSTGGTGIQKGKPTAKPAETSSKAASAFFQNYKPSYQGSSVSKSSDGPKFHGFKNSAKDQPSGLTASEQNKLNPFSSVNKPGSYDSKGKFVDISHHFCVSNCFSESL